MRRLFLSRITVIVLIGLVLAMITLGAQIPQVFITPAAALDTWRSAHPYLAPLANHLGLHHIYTTPVFAVVLCLSCISLGLSTIEQCRSAWRAIFSPRRGGGGRTFFTSLTTENAARKLSGQGYLCVVGGEAPRFVRHPWGYWGNALMHGGIMVVIAASLCIALTQQRGIVHLVEGETHLPSQSWLRSEEGLLGREFILPGLVRLEKVQFTFWPTHGVKELRSFLAFEAPDGKTEKKAVAVNSILGHGGLRVYQGIDFGHAFDVEVTAPSGKHQVLQLLINHPITPDKPSYETFPTALGEEYELLVKYFADEEKKSFDGDNPLLVIRLDHDSKEQGQLPLKVGVSGSIGQFHFRLLGIRTWSELIFVNLTGISGVFFGFFIIVLGGLLHYFLPPREIFLKPENEGCRAAWRAVRFAGFYEDEFERLQRELGVENG